MTDTQKPPEKKTRAQELTESIAALQRELKETRSELKTATDANRDALQKNYTDLQNEMRAEREKLIKIQTPPEPKEETPPAAPGTHPAPGTPPPAPQVGEQGPNPNPAPPRKRNWFRA